MKKSENILRNKKMRQKMHTHTLEIENKHLKKEQKGLQY